VHILEFSELDKILYEWNSHSHIYWEILVVTYGKATFFSNFGSLTINSGDLIIIPPDTKHSFTSKNGYKDRSIYIDKLNLDTDKLHILRGEENGFPDLTKMLMEAYKKEKEDRFSSFEEKSKFFIRHIMNLLSMEQDLPLCAKVRNYINTNFSDPALNEDYLAKRFVYNGNYLRRNFKSSYGLTPMQYLAFVRISQAKNLLRFAKNHSVGEISRQCGFPDQLYFSRFFKKHTGISPTEYRKSF